MKACVKLLGFYIYILECLCVGIYFYHIPVKKSYKDIWNLFMSLYIFLGKYII